MKLRTLTSIMLASSLVVGMASAPAFADDGEILRRSVSSPPGETQDPEPEGEHAFISLMNFHVPAQSASGDLRTGENALEYNNIDGELVKTEVKAKPLINVYVYGPVNSFDDFSQSGFPGHGRRDAFGAVSLDDGETWNVTNLSNSADLSSFDITTPIPDPGVPEGSGSVIVVDDPEGASIDTASWSAKNQGGKLAVDGESDSRDKVIIRNAVTQEELLKVRADKNGVFSAEKRLDVAPCFVQAGVDGVFGPATEVADAPETCDGPDTGGDTLITAYPGDVTNVFHSVAGNKVMVAWQSKFCSSGFPGYTGGSSADPDAVAAYLGINNDVDLYLADVFGVAGSQQSVDYREQEEFAGEYDDVGEVPYNCLWTARGVLREDPDAPGTTELVWLQAERLTSGRRDVNRIETKCVAGAGCAVTWQEDPAGLRPGEGEGAGTGWAGATTNSQTDIWYSFIEWEDFDIISDETSGEPVPLADLELETGRPQPYVPMMVPVRLTNNARCQTDAVDQYCSSGVDVAYGIKDQCVGTIEIPLGQSGALQPVCVVDANDSGAMDTGDMPNVGNTAASRPRLNLQPRDSDGDGVTDDAWVIIVHEEDKGLGRFGFVNDVAWDGNLESTGTACGDPDADLEDNCIEADIGKNQWYISFALGTPQTSVLDGVVAADVDFSMLNNIVAQQNMYNAPEVNWRTGTFYPPNSTADMWDFGDTLNFSIFNTEIARRASLMSQSLSRATTNASSRLVAMPLFKEGTINQGGPADIMARRIVAPVGVNEATQNPYDFANLACEWYDGEGGVTAGTMLFTDGLNPYYPKGLCTAPTINLSARTPLTCEPTGSSDGVCPTEDLTCTDDPAYGQLCTSTVDPEDNQLLDKLLSWIECPGATGNNVGGSGAAADPGCDGLTTGLDTLAANTDDRSWYMPIDIAKAHRGFLDGDFVSMIYAWSPNYKLNAVGNDRYELYTRRSFNGGVTWTTTPSTGTASDGVTAYGGSGTVTCETWRDGDGALTDSHVCTAYAAGDPEQSRNITQHKSMRVTTLDPRYTPAGGIPPTAVPTEGDLEWAIYEPIDPTDLLNPSRYFIVFETGDNTTTAVGEAEPLNLDYGRAEVFGDVFTVWTEIDTGLSSIGDCYPNNAYDTTDVDWAVGTGFCNEFDNLEGFPGAVSEEASITSSAYGDFLYGVWGQFNLDDEGEFVDGDSMFRRVWYLDDYISEDNAYTLPGDAQ